MLRDYACIFTYPSSRLLTLLHREGTVAVREKVNLFREHHGEDLFPVSHKSFLLVDELARVRL